VTTDAGETARELALEFTRALAARDYDRAYGMTSSKYRDRVSRAGLQDAFETMIPPDWGDTEPVQVMTSMSDWPDRGAQDVGWVYVSISGDVYSEALAAVITREGDRLKIREVEWGRP